MPTNFQISYHPTMRYVTAEPALVRTGPPHGAFTRWRHVERLVIHSGPEAVVKLPATPPVLPADLRAVFPR